MPPTYIPVVNVKKGSFGYAEFPARDQKAAHVARLRWKNRHAHGKSSDKRWSITTTVVARSSYCSLVWRGAVFITWMDVDDIFHSMCRFVAT